MSVLRQACTLMFCAALVTSSVHAADAKSFGRPLLDKALAGPLKDVEEVVFAVRRPYDDPHWYANIGYFCDDENHKAYAGNGTPDVGQLCKLNVHTGEVSVLFDAPGGSVRDPEVHYDARKVLFSHRPADTDYYHLYEINLDGSGLKQLTDGNFDDYEPCYLPDGGIVFVSTRCQCWVNCWKTQVGVLYRCDGEGGNIQRISHNAEHDNTPCVLPDGRILYTRWEYVDRSQVEFHHLWTMNPDGSGEMVYFGNMHPGIVMIDAKPIPDSRKVLVNFSPGHGITDHQGQAVIVSQTHGPDARHAVQKIPRRGDWLKDPYPLSAEFFLAAQKNRIVLFDSRGAMQTLYQQQGLGQLHEPRPVRVRPRERVIARRTESEESTGRLLLADVYHGRNMQGVQRGDIQKLLVLELLPKQVNFSGGPDLVSWLGTFSLERVLGTVPVEEDGSAYFEVPAGRPLFFVALDENDLSVKRMHSFVSVMPGETTGCVGCHEQRSTSPLQQLAPVAALSRKPDRIEPFYRLPDVLDFPRDIQPILDEHCVECHNYQRREGGVLLTGDLGRQWSHAYFHLLAHLQVADGRNGLGNYAPRSIGSSASPLLNKLDPSHHGVRVTEDEWRTVWMWIESGAPYAGSYAGLRNLEEQLLENKAGWSGLAASDGVLKRRCSQCHDLGVPVRIAVRSADRKHHFLAVDKTNDASRRRFPYNPISANNRRGLDRATGVWERVVLPNDPLTKYSNHILVNLTRPHLSPLILAPLAREAGGWGSCGDVFADTNDPDYQRVLAALEAGKQLLGDRARYGEPGFRPNRQYVREMKKYGILPASFDPHTSPIDIFATDQAYWRTYRLDEDDYQ